MKKNKGLILSLFSVTGVLIISKLIGFIKQIITASYFGATLETDLIQLSEGFISNIDYILVNTISTALITQYVYLKVKDNEEKNRLVTNTIVVFFVGTIVLSGILMCLTPFIAKLIAPSYSNENTIVLMNYLLVLLPIISVVTLSSIFSGILQAEKKFIPNQLSSVIQSVIAMTMIFIFGKIIGPQILIPAFIIYSIVNCLFLFVLSKPKWKIMKPNKNPFKDNNFVSLLKVMLPLFLGYSMIFINQQIDKIIVSGLGDGAVTAMSYSSVLSNLIIAIISALSGVMYSHITNDLADGNEKLAINVATKYFNISLLVLVPITILTAFYSEDVIRIVYGRGKFDEQAVVVASAALLGYSFSFIFYSIKSLFNKLLYAYKDTKWPMISTMIGIVVNIILSIVLSRFFGVLGVTIASSASELVACIINYIVIKKKNIPLKFRYKFLQLLKFIIMILIVVFISIFIKKINLNFIVEFILSVIVSFMVIVLLYSYDLYKIIKTFRNKNKLNDMLIKEKDNVDSLVDSDSNNI